MSQTETPHGITLEFETFGSNQNPPLLLVSGLGAQLVSWPRQFCQGLADGDRFVIAFDNRDCGLSSKLEGRGAELSSIIAAAAAGNRALARSLAAYTLSDMSQDALALLDALGIEQAHVLGASMGGAIAQTMAIEHPDRLLSLTSMMSSTGEPDFGQSTPEAMQVLLAPSPTERDAYIEAADNTLVWRSKKYPDLDAVRQVAAESYDRCFYPQGVGRQLAAMIASGSRADGLGSVTVPTLVIHGLDDTLITPSGGERIAELIPGAHLVLINDMGHDRPAPLWPQLLEAVLRHTSRP
jgi:pimeloyl-ACP methyl ester carboxylesterase